MKILSKEKVNEIDILTTSVHSFIDNLPNDSIKRPFEKINAITRLNGVRRLIELPEIMPASPRPTLLSIRPEIPMPIVEPCKKPEHEHDYFTAHQTATGATICCRICGKVKRIEANPPIKDKAQPEYIKISIDDFNDCCDAAATFTELKELLIEHSKS